MGLFDDDIYDDALIEDDDDESPEVITTQAVSEGLLPPQRNPNCIGHEKQEKLFLDLFEKKTMPHAMIFSGPQGIGKATMAFRLARFLLKHGTAEQEEAGLFGDEPLKHTSLSIDPADPVFTRVASGGHADFRSIERGFDEEKGKGKKNLGIDLIREIAPFLRMKAANGGWRVAIVHDADTMTNDAQNAILKILEEPPPNALIILIAHRPGSLIPTIRSRARVITFDPLQDTDLQSLLQNQGFMIPPSDLKALYAMAGGSAGYTLKLAEDGGLNIFRNIMELLEDPSFPDWVKIHELARELGENSQDKQYRIFTEIMEWIFRQLLFAKARGQNEPPEILRNPRLAALMHSAALEKLIKISDDLKNLYIRTDFSNLDRRDAVRGSFVVINQ